MRRQTMAMAAVILVAIAAGTARANPTQEDVFKSISSSVDHSGGVSGTTLAAIAAAVVGVVLLAVVVNARQARSEAGAWSTGGGSSGPATSGSRRSAGPVNHPGKLVRELMRETGLTRAQVRQLEAANDRLAADDRGVEHLATLLLCPSLLAASRGDGERR